MQPDNQTTRRIFFALWPDRTLREAIVARRQQLGLLSKRLVPDYNLHLTLLFLGNQPADRLDDLLAAVNAIQAQRFLLVLDEYGWFERPQVVWLGGEAVPAGCQLVDALGMISQRLGLRYFKRDWKPHITLFRKVDAVPDVVQPVALDWQAQEFVLIESIPNQPYRVLQRWGLE